jgi:peptidoglycan L-alanyl-D-glutamate endopeptidase CwlK
VIRFGAGSLAVRATLAPPLVVLVDDVAGFVPAKFDFSLICGFRDKAAQAKAFADKASTKQWPDSMHNVMRDGLPFSLAVDVAPYDVDLKAPAWKDDLRIARLIGIFDARAIALRIPIRVGLDFDGDGKSRGDERFIDAWHIELDGELARQYGR